MYEQDPWLLEMQERQAVKKQEEDFRRKVTDKLMALQERESFTFGREWLCHAEDQLNPVSRSWIVEEVAERLRLFSMPSPALVHLRGLHRSMTTLQDAKDSLYSLLSYMPPQEDEVGSGDAGSVMVVNCSEYADEIQEKLSAIPLHSNLLVSTDSYLDRSIVQLVAKRMSLVAVIEEVGTTEECVVYNVPSDFVEKIEIQLNGLCQDEGVFLSQGLTKEETQLARVLSENLGFLTTTNADGSVTAFNLQEFEREMRTQLSDIPVGDEIRMAMGTRTEEQQYMIYRLVKELGLELQEEGQKKQREAIIGNMKGLIKELKNTLMAAQPGDVLKFMLPVRENQQQAFFSVAGDYGYECVEKEKTDSGIEATLGPVSIDKASVAQRRRRSSIIKQGSAPEVASAPVAVHPRKAQNEEEPDEASSSSSSSSEGLESSSEESLGLESLPEPIERKPGEDHLIARVFQQYASGRWIGQALFLRYGDLKGFAEDLKYVTPNVDTKLYRFTGMFEYVFEDTLQLQIDMGVRVRHGLTFDWFQIFLQKIILRLGIQFVPVLFQLLDNAD